ncbi:hypothetical protein [Flaviflexus equikiangi]|uniref:Uncharacterized protein n=1 Tax=Flaviflexus equikiangi TaxID=2758573 RepID=A0ABS2TCI0_9ACTO|nr:hypothetical protein [Flaviflexus equikiangi]MBM9432353.1 hypothetical protein [Flaviflexus equikiangi]
MRAFIDHGELRIVSGNQTYRTLIPSLNAKNLARELRRAHRAPKEKRWAWPGGGSFTIYATPSDPHPMIVLHDRHEIEPTVLELQQLIETLENYGRTR